MMSSQGDRCLPAPRARVTCRRRESNLTSVSRKLAVTTRSGAVDVARWAGLL
jgi:hypothetical protein